MHYNELNKALGNIDLYLLDQILKGRFEGKHKILDAGCGEGRNLRYFTDNGYDVYGVDNNALAIQMAQMTYRNIPVENWRVGNIENMDWPDQSFDAIICNAVLHFVESEIHFFQLMNQLTRVLKSGGILFIRTASLIGLDRTSPDLNGFNFRIDERIYQSILENYNLTPLEPFKSVIVDNVRSMAALTLRKH